MKQSCQSIEHIQNRKYSVRNRKVREFPDMVRLQTFIVASQEPTSVQEALSSPERPMETCNGKGT